MTSDPNANIWFYSSPSQDEHFGPVSINTLRTLFHRTKSISGDTLMWTAGMPNWATFDSIPSLNATVKYSPPTPQQSNAPHGVSGNFSEGRKDGGYRGGSTERIVTNFYVQPSDDVRSKYSREMDRSTKSMISDEGSHQSRQNPSNSFQKLRLSTDALSDAVSSITMDEQRAHHRGIQGGLPEDREGEKSIPAWAARRISPTAGSAAKQNYLVGDYGMPVKILSPVASPNKGKPNSFAQARFSRNSRKMPSIDLHWTEKLTADGVPYYYNTRTKAVSWDKPDFLKSPEEVASDSGEWVWVSDETELWLPAKILSMEQSGAHVQLQSGRHRYIKKSEEPMWPVTSSQLRFIEDDLVLLENLNEALILHCLKERYRKNQIYTWVGADHTVLISINPYKRLPIYTVSHMSTFSKPSLNRNIPPHTFAITNNAFTKMRMNAQNQAILISGESGAGKTEATKQCLSFLTEISSSRHAADIDSRILSANPVLEAFGNAKTIRNDNSSRFGRWIQISFDQQKGTIQGAKIQNFLLEKARVSNVARGERNYHILYQLCASNFAGPMMLQEADTYRYLNSGGVLQLSGVNDRLDFQDLNMSLDALGFSNEEKDWMYRMCGCCIHLGNLNFVGDATNGSSVDQYSNDTLHIVAGLLQVNPFQLSQCLTSRALNVEGCSNIHMIQTPEKCQQMCDNLAKHIYGRLFDWIINRINNSIYGRGDKIIGCLDIFGFEVLGKNSFEQLCINLTNEKLQRNFNDNTFDLEESLYRKEGIKFQPVYYYDNSDTIALIEGPSGLIPLLNDEIKTSEGKESRWLQRVEAAQKGNKRWVSTEISRRMQVPEGCFIIKHYAGDVTYDSLGFCAKNKDTLPIGIYDTLMTSGDDHTRQLFPPEGKNPKRTQTIGETFVRQLRDLNAILDACEPHYIRCIKPNEDKQPSKFISRQVAEQLRFSGVFETVLIRKDGFPFRLPHQTFAARYRCLLMLQDGYSILGAANPRDKCIEIMNGLPQDFSEVQIGRFLILYRAEEHRILELLRNLALEKVVPIAQRAARRGIGRRYLRYLRECRTTMQKAAESSVTIEQIDYELEKYRQLVGPCEILFPFQPPEIVKLYQLRHKLQERAELMNVLRDLLTKDPERHYSEYAEAIHRLDLISDVPATDEQVHMERMLREKMQTCVGRKLDPLGAQALEIVDTQLMMEVLSEANKFHYSSPIIHDIENLLSIPEEDLIKLQLKVANQTNDPDRAINREIRLKELMLEHHKHLYELARYPKLRDRYEWAHAGFRGLGGSQEELAAIFLKHTQRPIHRSLTRLSSATNKVAIKQFRSLMAYMGDRPYQYPDSMAKDYLAVGLENNENLREELYVQVMKQITDNPKTASLHKGFDILALMLSSFPPPPPIENFVACFIKYNSDPRMKETFMSALYMIVYGGQRKRAPSMKEIPEILENFYRREISGIYRSEDFLGGDMHKDERGPATTVHDAVSVHTSKTSHFSTASSIPPSMPPREIATVVETFIDNGPEAESTLNVAQGAAVTILDREDSDWWLVTDGNQEGWVPASFLEITDGR